MAEKILNTRIQNRIDTLAHWLDADPILKKGEIAIVEVPTVKDEVKEIPYEAPSYLMKVGDGTHKFSELDYTYAKAADVHAWAKAANKPVYEAEEIVGLENFIAGEIKDTNTLYKLEQDANNKRIIRLYSRAHDAAEDAEWTVVSELVLEDCSALITNAINALDATVASTDVEAGKGVKVTVVETDGKLTSVSVEGNYDNTYDAKGAAEAVRGELNSYKTTNNAAIEGINNTIATLATKEELNTAKGDLNTAIGEVADDLAEHIEAQNALNATLATKDEVKEVADDLAEHVAAQAELNDTYATKEELADEVEEINGTISTLEGKVKSQGETLETYRRLADLHDDYFIQTVGIKAWSTLFPNDNMVGAIHQNKLDIAKLNGGADTTGSVANTVKTAIDGLDLENTYEAKGEAAKVSQALESYKGTNDAAVQANADAIAAETERAEAAESALDERLDKIELFFEGAAEDEGEGESLKNALDTLKEIQDYINADGAAADAMVKDIADNKKAIEDLKAEHDQDIIDVNAAIALKADQTTVDGIDERLEVVEGKVSTLEGKMTAVEAAVATKVEQEAYNTKVQELVSADAGQVERIAALEAKFGEGDGSVADMIAEAKQEAIDAAAADATAKANAAEANAKAHADTEVGKEKARAEAAEKALDEKIDAAAETAANATAQALIDAKAYTDAEVAKVKAVADTAVQKITASEGLVATRDEESNTVNLAIDDTITFVFNCGDAYEKPIK